MTKSGGTYLFVSKNSTDGLAPSTVFFLSRGEALAGSLCRLFTKEYSKAESPLYFGAVQACDVPIEDRALLDEELSWIDACSDPDVGAYDPPPTAWMHERGQLSNRASEWETLLLRAESRGGPHVQSSDGHAAQSSAVEPPPDRQNVADVVVLLMLMRYLVSVQRDYPDAMSNGEYRATAAMLRKQIDVCLGLGGFGLLKEAMAQPGLAKLDPDLVLSTLIAVAVSLHPSMPQLADEARRIGDAMGHALDLCQKEASPLVQSMASGLTKTMVWACRCPSGPYKPEFFDPSRHLQMLERYWALMSRLVSLQAHEKVGFRPHALLQLIVNLQDRLRTHFGMLGVVPGAAEAAAISENLAGLLVDGEFDDLSADPEWTDGQLQKVAAFIARAGLTVKPREFECTRAEAFFLAAAGKAVGEHAQELKSKWNDMLARARSTKAQDRARPEVRRGPTGTQAEDSATAAPGSIATPQVGPMIDDLVSEAGISNDTFERVRKKAGIKISETGGAARKRRYSRDEVDRLIAAALEGSFQERRRMAEKWAKWGSNAASTPHRGN